MAAAVRVQRGEALSLSHEPGDFTTLRLLMLRAARAALRHNGITDAEVSVTLLDDAQIAEMNQRFLSHDGATDVISFPLYEADETPVGDIYIGWEQASRQASQNGVSIRDELARLTVHGVLHVLGYDHPEGEERLQSDMWALQETILAGLGIE